MSTSNWIPCAGCSCPNHHFPPPNTFSENSSSTAIDLTRLMRSNDQPSPAEADAIRGMISQHEEHVATTDLRIAALGDFRQDMVNLISKADEMIATLRGERERILVKIQEKKGLLSAVRRLPPELLFQIFRETIEFPIKYAQSDRDALWWDFTPAQSSLWIIELVSQHWRTVALTFPELWSYLNIFITDHGFAEGEYRLIRRLGLQLARSQQSLLSLSICDNSNYKKLPSSLELLLFSVSTRLRVLHLCITAEMLSAIPSLKLSLPSFEILSILCTDSINISEYSDLQLVYNAPKLRDLTFIDVEDPAESFTFPWAQITRCNISCAYIKEQIPGPDPARFLKVLRLMANLTSCDLVCEAYTDELEAEPVVCTKLQDFTLTSWPCRKAIPQLFSKLLLPSLSVFKAKFSVGLSRPNPEDTFRSIRHAINVSQSPLTTLELENGFIAEEDLLSILRTTPTLEFLKLVDVGPHAITDQTLDELMVRPNEDFIMPRLSSLHFSAEVEFTSQKFIAMVESRQKGLLGVDRLKSVNICWVTDEDDLNENEASGVVMLSALDTYRSEGLEFILTMQKKPAQDSEDETED
ncbi:hypothetical protein EV421DRAFT_1756748 [Armillaria borealis]|uniref:F-box domain-containing protein n=1 Tax=Armillaria borealis TaxID=47425 RepID=A0AA39K4H3_9AGAR|nr:hypothetical protein EV421DRAFT_1756748 [Armillaria borealis]